MAGYFDGQSSSTLLEDLNRVLLIGAVPPVPTLSSISMDSDAGLALGILRNTQRAKAARGWWFNTDIRVEFVPDGSSLIAITNASSVTATRRLPGDPWFPRVRLEVAEGGSGGNLRNLDTDDFLFDDTTVLLDGSMYVDVIRQLDNDNMPQEFREYCVQCAGRQFARPMGIKVDAEDERFAYDQLDKANSARMEVHNTLNNPTTYNIWNR